MGHGGRAPAAILAAILLLLPFGASGCTRTTAPATPGKPAAMGSPAAVRTTSHSTADVLGDASAIWGWTEADLRPAISDLLRGREGGVWGGQDGQLFFFGVLADTSYGRITFGRPDPAAFWAGDLHWVFDQHFVGRMYTRHLVRMAPDGTVTELGPALSPAGAPFDFLDDRGGKLHLHDRDGGWYTINADGAGFEPVPELTSGQRTGSPGLGETVHKEIERATGGSVQAWIVPTADGNRYALVNREQLFVFDLASRRFTPLGHPDLVPVGNLNGQIVTRAADRLVILDATGQMVREFALDLGGSNVFQGRDGWFHSQPVAINLVTGEVRRPGIPGLPGGVNTLIPFGNGQLLGGTDFGGSLFVLDEATGQTAVWGRPVPELGQESGEERAPINGLAVGTDGDIYAVIGAGASSRRESLLVRMDEQGKVLAKTLVAEVVSGLVQGADERIYGSAYARVLVLPPANLVR